MKTGRTSREALGVGIHDGRRARHADITVPGDQLLDDLAATPGVLVGGLESLLGEIALGLCDPVGYSIGDSAGIKTRISVVPPSEDCPESSPPHAAVGVPPDAAASWMVLFVTG